MKKTERIDIHNRFDIEVIDAKTGQVKQKAQAFNVILNNFWTRFFANTANAAPFNTHILYGSGSGTPSASDTSLFHHENAITSAEDNSGEDFENHVTWYRQKAQITESMSVGVNITEVGIGYGTSANNLCTHAMLQDMNGNPISINKTNTDIINIYSTLYVHWSSNVSPFLLQMVHTEDYASRLNLTLFPWIFGTHPYIYYDSVSVIGITFGKEAIVRGSDSSPSYAADNPVTTPSPQYVGGGGNYTIDSANKKVTFGVTRLAVENGNIDGGIGCAWMCYRSSNKTGGPLLYVSAEENSLGTSISGEAVGTGDGTTVNFRTKYDFPSNVNVYINGTLQTSGYTIAQNKPSSAIAMRHYCRYLSDKATLAHMLIDQNPVCGNSTVGGDNVYPAVGKILFNKAYAVGVAKFNRQHYTSGNVKLYGSNDLQTWALLIDDDWSGDKTLTGTDQHYKFYRVEGVQDNMALVFNTNDRAVIVFNNPPASGAIITADYHTPYIAKDSDHVLDFSIEFQFGEYQGA